MVYVQYLEKGPISGELIETCGDRGIVILDGRNSITTIHNDAKRFNGYKRPFYDAYRIYEGENLLRSSPISDIVLLENNQIEVKQCQHGQ